MTESEYSEENLDEFMLRASKVLCEKNHPDTSLIIDSLKEHLSSIFPEKFEMENFFKTLNFVIFSKEESTSNNIVNIQPFKLYPLVFSFNPKTSFYYVDYFLTSLQVSCQSEKNINHFSFLSSIFAEVITSFFSDEKSNKFLIKKNMLLDQNKKSKLYEKIFGFCSNNIKTNEPTKESFGCLLLTEFIEKCPLVKEEKNFENVFKIICDYLDDHWFECKLDLLNCTQSLIYAMEKKFRPYVNVCIFKILDFFTDEDWMKRKLAVNIVYTLVFYCKEEILKIKDNIIDFLNVLKDDPVEKVKEACIRTLNFIDKCDPDKDKENNDDFDMDNIGNDNGDLKENKSGENKDKENNEEETKNKNKEDKDKKDDENYINISDINIKEMEDIKNGENNKDEKDAKNNNDNMKILDIKINNKELNEKYGETLNEILAQMKQIQETQNILNNSLENIRYNIDKNYSSLNSRLKILETESEKRNNII